MRPSNPIAQQRAARSLDAHWDAVVAAAPAEVIPPDDIDRQDASTIRRLHARSVSLAPDAAFADSLLENLLAAIPESPSSPVTVTRIDPATVPAGIPTRPGTATRRFEPVLEIAAIVLIVILAGIGLWYVSANDLFERSAPAPLTGPVATTAATEPPASIAFDGIRTSVAWQADASAGLSEVICDVAVSEEGNVYVVDCLANTIRVFDSDGVLIDTWGSYGSDPGQFRFGTPNQNMGGIDLDAEGNVYVFDTGNNRIQKFSPEHAFMLQWGRPGIGVGEFRSPLGVVDRNTARVYVADSANSRVQVFDLNGTYLDQWGEVGDLDGQFQTPVAIAVGNDSTVYVADPVAARIQHFDPAGVYLGEIGTPGQLGAITDIALLPEGYLVAAVPDQGLLMVFDPDGIFLDTITSIEGAGALDAPHQIACSHNGRLHILISAGAYERLPGRPIGSQIAPSRVIAVDLSGLGTP